MRTKFFVCIFLCCLTGTISILTGCGGSSSSPSPVTQVTLRSIAVSPAGASVVTGATQQLKATGTYSDSSTKDLTATVTWTSSNKAIATIAPSGLATTVAQGNVTITAASGYISGHTVLTVYTPTLLSIAVTPAVPTIDSGRTQQFTAIGAYSDSTSRTITTSVTWTSSNLPAATISSAGLATAVGPGQTTITAACSGVQGTAVLTVQGLSRNYSGTASVGDFLNISIVLSWPGSAQAAFA